MDWTESVLFREISSDKKAPIIAFLDPFIKRVQIKAGDTFLKAGELPQYQVLIERGVLHSVHYASEGEERSAFYYVAGTSVFHVACLTQHPVQSYCMAVQDAQLVLIPRERFVSAVKTFPELEFSLLMYMCSSSERLVEHAITVQMKKPRLRICKHLVEHVREENLAYQLPFNMEQFATYLNLARPTLSKELHKMEDDGLIKIYRGMIQVLSIEKLCDELG